ncbi:hypothetical protein F4825DRAFT_373914 [Nemania diffusa]|nr:hypothetical protein F4825DRAFT_373914 [Nemania diffusa]
MSVVFYTGDDDSDTTSSLGEPRRRSACDYYTRCAIVPRLSANPSTRYHHHRPTVCTAWNNGWGGAVRGLVRLKNCNNPEHYALAFHPGADTSRLPSRLGGFRTRLPASCHRESAELVYFEPAEIAYFEPAELEYYDPAELEYDGPALLEYDDYYPGYPYADAFIAAPRRIARAETWTFEPATFENPAPYEYEEWEWEEPRGRGYAYGGGHDDGYADRGGPWRRSLGSGLGRGPGFVHQWEDVAVPSRNTSDAGSERGSGSEGSGEDDGEDDGEDSGEGSVDGSVVAEDQAE